MSESVEEKTSIEYKFENEKIQKEFRDLKKRIKATRKSRLQASKRLRADHNYYEKVINLYSLLLLVLSIWTLGDKGEDISTNILLISSLALTYLTMFLNIKNFKERAAKFESNYQDLDILTNKMDRYEASSEIIVNTELLKQLQREYEKSIVGNENHLDIDFYITQYNQDNWNNDGKSAHELKKQQDLKSKILRFKIIAVIKKTLIALFPLLILVLIKVYKSIIFLFNLTSAP